VTVPDFGWQGQLTLTPEQFTFPMPESEKEYGAIPKPEVEEEVEVEK
jgi:hypothetical protein